MRKPFNVEAAKSGAKVVTGDGRPVRILCYDNTEQDYPIVAVVYEHESNCVQEYTDYTENGDYCIVIENNGCDLFIEVEQTYRPYANAAEMDAAIKEHGLFVKHCNGKRLAIKGYDDNDVSVGAGCNYWALLEYFTWIDGTPCGVQEGGEE